MNASNRYVGFGLATLSGCLWFLACTPFDWWGLGWIAAVPALLAIDRAPTVKTALLWGWWAGVVETAGGFYWLIDVMQRFANVPWVGGALVLLLFCATRALIFLISTAIICTLRRRRVPMTLIAPLAMVAGEFIVPQLFPCGQWITQAWHPLIIQIAELTGPLGVTGLLMLVNGAIYDAVARDRLAWRHGAVAVAVVAAALIFGTIRMRQIDALVARAPRLDIGLVQPNIAYPTDSDVSNEEALRQLHLLQEQSRRLERAGAQLLIWSEGSYPVALPRYLDADLPLESIGMIRRGFSAPVIIGANTIDTTNDDAYNSAWLFDRDGRIAGRYDKVRLLAFGEYVPGMDTFPWLSRFLPNGSSRFQAGAGPTIMSTVDRAGKTWRLGPVICYEDLLADFLRDLGKLHPDVLVNLTVDSWYGARAEPWEHLALAVFSTIELRVSLVRAVNSGVSAIIDPNGRLLDKTYADDPYREPRAADGIVVSAPKMSGGHTLFVSWGNWFPYSSMACLLGIFWAVRMRRQAL